MQVSGPDRDDPSRICNDYLTPCSPGDPDAQEMNWIQVDGSKLKEPEVTFNDFLKSLRSSKPSVSKDDITEHTKFTTEFGQEVLLEQYHRRLLIRLMCFVFRFQSCRVNVGRHHTSWTDQRISSSLSTKCNCTLSDFHQHLTTTTTLLHSRTLHDSRFSLFSLSASDLQPFVTLLVTYY